jgi:hypothetical protein
MGRKKRLTKRGGAKNTLPLPETIAAAMREWNFFTVSAHGSLTGQMMVVPPNTYILNIATAGLPCFKVSWALENWIYDYSPSLAASSKTIFQKLYESIKGKTFLRDLAPGMSHIYEPGNTGLNLLEQYNASMGRSEQQTVAFYEPGDLMFNTRLNMNNHNWPMFLMGAYEIPVPYSMKKAVFKKNAFLYGEGENADTIGYEELVEATTKPISEEIKKPGAEAHKIFDVEENLLKPDMFPEGAAPIHDFVLSDVIAKVNERVIDNKQHLFIVRACRVAPSEPIRNRMRRFSIAARERPRIGIEDPAKILRSRLTVTLLDKIKAALQAKKPSVPLFQKASISEAVELINEIKAGGPFTMDTVQEILERANQFITFQPEFKTLMGLV